MGSAQDSWQAKIANSDVSIVGVDENVVAFDVSVDDGRWEFVKVFKSLKDFLAPVFDNLSSGVFVLGYVLAEGTSWEKFSDYDYLLGFLIHPGVNKVDDIGVVQTLDYLNFLVNSLLVRYCYSNLLFGRNLREITFQAISAPVSSS